MTLLTRPRLTQSEREAKWAAAYATQKAMLWESGDTAYLQVPMADQNHDTGLVVTTLGTEQVAGTYSQSQSVFDFDTPPSYIGPWGVPIIHLNDSDEWLQFPDAGFWDDSAATDEPAYCMAMWVNVIASISASPLWTKTSSIGVNGQSWAFWINSSEKLRFWVFDDSAGAYIGKEADTAISDGIHQLVVTKSDDNAGGTPTELASDIILYVDGASVAISDQNSGTYLAQEASSTAVTIGAESDGDNPAQSGILGASHGPIFNAKGTNAVWTPNQVRRHYQFGRALLGPAAGL